MQKTASQNIYFHYLVKPFYFPDRNHLKKFLATQLVSYKRKVEAINYIFCDDAYLLNINQAYLKHSTFTDIVTFELSLKGQPLLADIYISAERVKENSIKFSESFIDELHRVIFHGLLHLVGYDDKSISQIKKMRNKENEWLSLYNVPRGKGKLNINTFPVEQKDNFVSYVSRI